MKRRNPRLDIIKRALQTSDRADLAGTAMNIFVALYGRPTEQATPVEQVEAAHQRRDFYGVIEAARAGQQSLEAQPWYPARAGDIVHIHFEAIDEAFPAHGATYIITEPQEGSFNLTQLVNSRGEAGEFAVEDAPDPLMEMWFEAGPHRLTIVRDGRVVHGGA